MSRIKLELPEAQQFIFNATIAPRISDINYGKKRIIRIPPAFAALIK